MVVVLAYRLRLAAMLIDLLNLFRPMMHCVGQHANGNANGHANGHVNIDHVAVVMNQRPRKHCFD